jgi:hypothetical protein
MDGELRIYPYFLANFRPFFKNGKSAEAENGRKVKAIALLFGQFSTFFSKMEKVAENGQTVKATALLFGQFSTFFQKWKKWMKMDGKLRL